MPSRQGPVIALILMPLVWWLMHELATGNGPRAHSRAAFKAAFLKPIAEFFGPQGCVIMGFVTTAAALVWLWWTVQERKKWQEAERLEGIRERQRMLRERKAAEDRFRS